MSELPPSLPPLPAASSLLLALLPSLLATALFRISVFALMFTFLDYWALIPLAALWLANLTLLTLCRRPLARVTPQGPPQARALKGTSQATVAPQGPPQAYGWREEVGAPSPPFYLLPRF